MALRIRKKLFHHIFCSHPVHRLWIYQYIIFFDLTDSINCRPKMWLHLTKFFKTPERLVIISNVSINDFIIILIYNNICFICLLFSCLEREKKERDRERIFLFVWENYRTNIERVRPHKQKKQENFQLHTCRVIFLVRKGMRNLASIFVKPFKAIRLVSLHSSSVNCSASTALPCIKQEENMQSVWKLIVSLKRKYTPDTNLGFWLATNCQCSLVSILLKQTNHITQHFQHI